MCLKFQPYELHEHFDYISTLFEKSKLERRKFCVFPAEIFIV